MPSGPHSGLKVYLPTGQCKIGLGTTLERPEKLVASYLKRPVIIAEGASELSTKLRV